jgi:hypothetical protein
VLLRLVPPEARRKEVRDRCLLLLIFRPALRVSEALPDKAGSGRTAARAHKKGPDQGLSPSDTRLRAIFFAASSATLGRITR